MSDIEIKRTEASMGRQIQLSFDFQCVTERFESQVAASQHECRPRLALGREMPSRSNVFLFNPRVPVSGHAQSDLIGRILKSVRFYG